MKKILRKTLSMLLAVSALCILFAFHASAISTTCQECGGSNIDYIPLGNVGEPNAPLYHHEVYCNDCGHSVDEEECDIPSLTDCTANRSCSGCGFTIYGNAHHNSQISDSILEYHTYSCTVSGCQFSFNEPHTPYVTNNGAIYCVECNYFLGYMN